MLNEKLQPCAWLSLTAQSSSFHTDWYCMRGLHDGYHPKPLAGGGWVVISLYISRTFLNIVPELAKLS